MLYGVSTLPEVSARVTNGAKAPMSRPEMTQTITLFLDTAELADFNAPYALPSKITATIARITPMESSTASPFG
jgi:hypothetical protein